MGNIKRDEFDIVQEQLQNHKDNQDANLCIPSLNYQKIPGSIWVPALEAIYISTDAKAKEVYPGSVKGKFRLHARALYKIAQAGNVQWEPNRSGPISMGDSNVIGYKSVGGIRKGTGELMIFDGYKDMDLDVELDVIRETYDKKRSDYDRSTPQWWGKMSDDAKTNYIENCVTRDFTAKKRYAPEMCETGARCRVIRALFPDISSEFDAAELKKPFVVLRFRINLNHENPEIRNALQQQQLLSAMGVFGNAPATPAQPMALPEPMTQALPEPITPDDDPNLAGLNDQEDEPPAQKEPEPEQKKEDPPLTNAKADFEACDHKGKIEVLEQLMERKNYPASDLKHPLSSQIWVDHPESLDKLFNHLSALPDAVKDEIPY